MDDYRKMIGPSKRVTAQLKELEAHLDSMTDDELDEVDELLRQIKAAVTPTPVAKRKGPPKVNHDRRRLAQVNAKVAAYTFDEPRQLVNGRSKLPARLKKSVTITVPKPTARYIQATTTGIIQSNRADMRRVGLPQGMPPHLVIDAVAGSGKTTILEEGTRRIFGKPPKFKGSDQQEAIWAEMVRGPRPKTVVVMSCMNSIVDELANRLIAPAYATTCHKFGRQLIYKNIGARKPDIEEDKVRFLLQDYMEMTLHTIYRRMPRFVNSVCQLVKFCKYGLVDLDLIDDKATVEDEIQRLIGTYDIEVKDQYMDMLPQVIPAILKMSGEKLDTIDFDDMLWLPHRLKITSRPYDLLMVDERQDLNHAQQEMILKNGKRIIMVGDTHQAIMGFAGGDFEACEHMNEKLSASRFGCKVMPLTYTRRCCQAITRLAQTLVPEIECLPDAPEGEVIEQQESKFQREILSLVDGDMVICRTNAPLAQYAMQLLKNKRAVRIQGRNIGEDLIKLIEGFKADDLVDLTKKVDDWYYHAKAKLEAKKYVSESSLIALADQYSSMLTFIREATSIAEVISMIRQLFSDDKGSGVLFSSIHRAKGLEPPTGRVVYFLRYNLLPHPMAQSLKAKKQEYNLQYVGITRGKNTLVILYDDVSNKVPKKAKNNAPTED